MECNVSGLNLAECFATLYCCEVNETKNEPRNVNQKPRLAWDATRWSETRVAERGRPWDLGIRTG